MNYKLLCGIFFFAFFSVAFAVNVEEGKNIFKTRCVSCHAIDRVLVGPALKNVDQKYDIEWFVKFVTSSTTLIASGDEKAVKIFTQFNKIPMPDHKDLDAEKIKKIYEYLKTESQNLSNGLPVNPIPRLENKKSSLRLNLNKNIWIIWLWVGLTFILILALIAAISVNEIKDKHQKP